MIQLLKYEAMKKWRLFLIAITVIFLAEGFILFQLKVKNNLAFGIGLFLFISYIGIFVIFIDSIQSYSRELKNKTGYSLFLVPRNAYEILGAKILIAFIEIILAFILFIIAFGINYDIIATAINSNMDFVYFIFTLIEDHISFRVIFANTFELLMSWFNFIIIAYLAITLSSTLLSQNKFKGFISFILFILINIVVHSFILDNLFKIINALTNLTSISMSIVSSFIIFIVSLLIYFLTAALLEKHIDL
ncbi:hypothetical protein EDC18_105177 [Natranaerovirga pectinivora]|uniref:ABC-2 family transporter n=1 Tax=Natranaerovirga pectinivora TaxID=682400 RepID=A0A4R3MK79_9FIRM|nr:hypothetical protein [Natranaerovirga pectinivora]TCT14695.1 hypothetical protein EDC18_105177 [Natranaerovirga pectinivora]